MGYVCYQPLEGESEDVWWFGFDCAHGGDFIPSIHGKMELRKYPSEIAKQIINYYTLMKEWNYKPCYRDIGYVKTQVEFLAAQLAQ